MLYSLIEQEEEMEQIEVQNLKTRSGRMIKALVKYSK